MPSVVDTTTQDVSSSRAGLPRGSPTSDGPARELSQIPVGHYHRVMESGHPVRRAWHILKFKRVLELCDVGAGPLIDIGCFAGSLLSLASKERFPRQLGVDILPDQVGYAEESFGAPFRRFVHIHSLSGLRLIDDKFNYATAVEVIEHLEFPEIRGLFIEVARLLTPGSGRFVISTPNYGSTWPVLEVFLNRFSDVDYSEQHVTRFRFFGFEKTLASIVPELGRYFTFEVKTTTHLFSPFLAVLGVDFATGVGSWLPHSTWRIPFGNLVLARLKRNDVEFSDGPR